MTPLQIILYAMGSITALGIAAGGIGFLIQSYKKGGRQERKDVADSADTIADFWKKQAEELKLILQTKDSEFNQKVDKLTKEFNEQIQALSKEVGTLTGQLNAEKLANDRMEKIFANRDPQTQEFMKLLTSAALKSEAYMMESRENEAKKMELWENIMDSMSEVHRLTLESYKILDARKTPVVIEGTMQSDTPEIN